MQLNIYNIGKQHEEEKERDIDNQIQKEEQAIMVVEKDMLT